MCRKGEDITINDGTHTPLTPLLPNYNSLLKISRHFEKKDSPFVREST